MNIRVLSVFILLSLILFTPSVHAQDGGTVDEELVQLADELYLEINRTLIDSEVRPLARNETLDQVAERIAAELSATGAYSSLPRTLADEFGYPRWPDGGQRVINAAINTIGILTPEEVAAEWNEQLVEILTTAFFREIGIGTGKRVAVEGGTEQNVYVIVMGAQPNVLPVVINDGSAEVDSREVSLYIHNELSLSYETDDDIIQRARNIRIANSQEDLEDAEWVLWGNEEVNNNFAVTWELTDEFGEKSVWVEFEDDKGTRLTSEAKVNYVEELGSSSSSTTSSEPTAQSVMLVMTYSDSTFTLQIQTEASTVNIEQLYFSWLDELRAYELENPTAMQDVNLIEFPSQDCIQIRPRSEDTPFEVAGCQNIHLEASSFIELDRVFWNPEFGTFDVFNGPTFLGTCDNLAGSCSLELN